MIESDLDGGDIDLEMQQFTHSRRICRCRRSTNTKFIQHFLVELGGLVSHCIQLFLYRVDLFF
jgi:hypothetical protein